MEQRHKTTFEFIPSLSNKEKHIFGNLSFFTNSFYFGTYFLSKKFCWRFKLFEIYVSRCKAKLPSMNYIIVESYEIVSSVRKLSSVETYGIFFGQMNFMELA